MLRSLLLCFIFSILSLPVLWGQKKFEIVDTTKGVVIKNKWAKEKLLSFGASEPRALLLRFENESSENVQIIYNLSIYKDGIKQYTSPKDTLSIKSGRRNHPRLKGNGVLLREDLSPDEVQ